MKRLLKHNETTAVILFSIGYVLMLLPVFRLDSVFLIPGLGLILFSPFYYFAIDEK